MVSVQGPEGRPASNWLFSRGIKYFLQLMSSNLNAYEVVGTNFFYFVFFFGLFEIKSFSIMQLWLSWNF